MARKQVVPGHRRFEIFRRKQPPVWPGIRHLAKPFPKILKNAIRQGCLSHRLRTLRAIQLAVVNVMSNIRGDSVDAFPPQRHDLSRSHSGDRGQLVNQPFSERKYRESQVDLIQRHDTDFVICAFTRSKQFRGGVSQQYAARHSTTLKFAVCVSREFWKKGKVVAAGEQESSIRSPKALNKKPGPDLAKRYFGVYQKERLRAFAGPSIRLWDELSR
jgi:hypothetical protein